MPYYGEAYYGMFYYGSDIPFEPPIALPIDSPSVITDPDIEGAVGPSDPIFGRAFDSKVIHRLLDVNGVPIEITDVSGEAAGAIIDGGSITGEVGAIPRMEGRLVIIDPAGDAASLFPKGTIVIPEKILIFPDGRRYGYSYGRFGVVSNPRTVESRPDSYEQRLEIEIIQQSEIVLNFSVSGNLMTQALPVATATGLLCADGTASVEGIMAWLLVEGGASAVGVKGIIRPTPAWSMKFGTILISSYILTREMTAREVMVKLTEHTGVGYWIDWDGSAVLEAGWSTAMDLAQQAPRRKFSERDPSTALSNRVAPSPGITPEQFKLLNQNSTGLVRDVSYVVPLGGGTPIPRTGSGPVRQGQFKRFDSALFAPPALDPNDKQDERAKQLALMESLAANEVELSIVPDPHFREGYTAILDYPSHQVNNELFWAKRKTDDFGEGDDTVLFQRLFTTDAPGAGDVGGRSYGWGTDVPVWKVPTWYPFIASGAIGPARPDLYNYTPSTFEGWFKLKQFQTKSGVNVASILFHTTGTVVKLSGGTAGVNASVTVNIFNDNYGLISSLTPFTQSVNDNVWTHWALQREPSWCGLAIGGIWKASAAGTFSLNNIPIGGFSQHLGWQSVGFMRRDDLGGDPPITPDAEGQYSSYSWRFSRYAVYPHTNFTPPAMDFRTNTPADYPVVVSVWPFLGLSEILLNPSDSFKQFVAPSSVSDQYATLVGLPNVTEFIAPPFPA